MIHTTCACRPLGITVIVIAYYCCVRPKVHTGFAFVPSRTPIRLLRIDLVFAILAVLLKDYEATVRRDMLEKRIESSSRGSREEEDHTSFTFDLCSKLASLLNSDGVQLLNTKYINEIN